MIRWADPEAVEAAALRYAKELRARSEVREVYWYGSWVSGHPTPRSDADICIVIADERRRPHERVPDYLPVGFPVPVDLTVLTEEEFAELPRHSPGLYAAITGERGCSVGQ